MANEKDVFEVRGPCKNRPLPIPLLGWAGGAAFFIVVNRETEEVVLQWEDRRDLEANLSEAFRLGYHAALMERV